jgi:hypothetical protein
MLGPPSAFDCLMLSAPTRKMVKSSSTLLIFLGMYFVVQASEVINIYPHLPEWAVIMQAVLVLYNVLMLVLVVCTNPGYIKQETSNDFLHLLEVADST